MNGAVLFGLGNVGMGYDFSPDGVLPEQTMSHVKALEFSDYFTLLAGIDSDERKLNLARNHYSSLFVSDVREINQSTKIRLVTVATPTNSHKSVVSDIPRTLIPEVLLIEKPAGMNSSECLWLEKWGEETSTKIFVNYFRRFLPEIQNARNFLSDMNLGDLISVQIFAYGTLKNIFSHFMDLGLFLSGRNLFCRCKKEILLKDQSNLDFNCLSCDVVYEFNGLNTQKRDCSVIIKFTNCTFNVILDGRSIIILNPSGVVVGTFVTSMKDYMNYQEIVYSEIAKGESGNCALVGLDEAISIHAFLESLEFKYVEG
jgi:predicted dehydrogenase